MRVLMWMSSSYWILFWLLNGLDKFMNRQPFMGMTWYGKDRTEQFGGYFERMNLPEGLVKPCLGTLGIYEILLALFMGLGLTLAYKNRDTMLKQGYVLTGLTFIGFCVFDVVAGDRAELLEHSTYMILVITSYALSFPRDIGKQLQL